MSKFFTLFEIERDIACRFPYHEAVGGWNGKMLKLVNGIVGALILISNAFLSYGIHKSKRRKYSRNEKMVLFLSAIDIMVSIIHTPLEIVLLTYLNYIGCFTISVIAFWVVFPLILSGSIVVVISIERFIVIFSDKKCCGLTFKEKYMLPIIIFYFITSISYGVWYANLHYYFPDTFVSFSYFFFSTATFIIINLVFGMMGNVLLLAKTSKRINNSEIHVASHAAIEKRLSKTMIIISVSLIASYFPSIITQYYTAIVLTIGKIESLFFAINISLWTLLFCKLNSALNGIIYITRSKKISKLYCSYFRSIVYKYSLKNVTKIRFSAKYRTEKNVTEIESIEVP